MVSFDIFDTLIIRDFYQPIDLFKYIEVKHQLSNFQKKRSEAEKKSRLKYSDKADITYDNIYENLKENDKSLEENVERKTCVANEEIRQLYDYACSLNKQIIAISDMYLYPSVIKQILDENGFIDIDKIYVSGFLNMRKSSGKLYLYVINDLGVNAEDIVHIGDNHNSDYVQASKLGIHGIYYRSFRDRLKETSNIYLLNKLKKHNTPQASLLSGMYSNEYFTKNNYWQQFGFQYGGVILYNFIQYVYAYCQKNHISRIYFMARDGKIMKEVFDTLYGNDKNIKTYYMYASRRLFFAPSLQKLDEETLNTLTASSRGTSFFTIIKKLDYDWLIDRAKDYFNDISLPVKSPSDREEIKQFLRMNQKDILLESEKERKNLMRYLKNISFFEDNNKLIVDVGWHSSSQKFLESMINEKLHAVYFGTNKLTYDHEYINGYFFHKGLPQKSNNLIYSSGSVAVFELLFIGDHHSIMKLDHNLNPVFNTETEEERIRISIALSIHKGILKFIKKYDMLLHKYELSSQDSLNEIILSSLLLNPSLNDIVHIAKIPHNGDMGNSTYEPIIKNLSQTQYDILKNIFLGKTSENKSFWSKGKRKYRELSNQKHSKSVELLSSFIDKIMLCLSYSFRVCMKMIFRKISKLTL